MSAWPRAKRWPASQTPSSEGASRQPANSGVLMPSMLHVLIQGRVQGVGFRHATYLQASRRGLTGWVRNLPDGRVEAHFEGPPGTLEEILAWCHKGPILSKVQSVRADWGEGEPESSSFEITF